MEIDYTLLEKYIFTNRKQELIQSFQPTSKEYIYLNSIEMINKNIFQNQEANNDNKIQNEVLNSKTRKQLVVWSILQEFSQKTTNEKRKRELVEQLNEQLKVSDKFSFNLNKFCQDKTNEIEDIQVHQGPVKTQKINQGPVKPLSKIELSQSSDESSIEQSPLIFHKKHVGPSKNKQLSQSSDDSSNNEEIDEEEVKSYEILPTQMKKQIKKREDQLQKNIKELNINDQNSLNLLTTSAILKQLLTNKKNFENIDKSAYNQIQFKDLPKDLEFEQYCQFIYNINLYNREDAVQEIKQLLNNNFKKIPQFQFPLVFNMFNYQQLQDFGNNNCHIKQFEYSFVKALINKRYNHQIQQFEFNISNMSNKDKEDYLEFLQELLEWLRSEFISNLEIVQMLISKILYCLLQINLELDRYNEQHLKDLFENPQFVVKKLAQSGFKAIYNNINYNVENQMNQYSFLECNMNIVQQVVFNYFYHIVLQNNNEMESLKYYYQYYDKQYLYQIVIQVIIEQGQQLPENMEDITPQFLDQLYKEKLIVFSQSNEKVYSIDQLVELKFYIKNIQEITINIFEINLENYYIESLKKFDQKINLDGIIPGYSNKLEINQKNGERKEHSFKLTELGKKRGIFVIEIVGGGIVSRGVIRKGFLSHLINLKENSYEISIVQDDQTICIPDINNHTGIIVNKQFFSANDQGKVILPFNCSDIQLGQINEVILVHNEFAQLQNVMFLDKSYEFKAVFMIQHQNFIKDSLASVLISTKLYLQGLSVQMIMLQDCQITVKVEYQNHGERLFQFNQQFTSDQDIKIEFPLISKPSKITFTASAILNEQIFKQVKSFSFQDYQSLKENQFLFNSLFLKQDEKNAYIVQVITKDGQKRSDIPLEIKIFNKYFNQIQQFQQKTNQNGELIIGQLQDCIKIEVNVLENANEVEKQKAIWNIQNHQELLLEIDYPRNICALQGQQIELPINSKGFQQDDYQLYSYCFDADQVSIIEDLISLVDYDQQSNTIWLDLSPGNYIFRIISQNVVIPIKILEGSPLQNLKFAFDTKMKKYYRLTDHQIYNIQIRSILFKENQNVEIQLEGDLEKQDETFKVHIFAYNFLDDINYIEDWIINFKQFTNQLSQESQKLFQLKNYKNISSNYFSNKILSDEYVYSLQRQNQEKFQSLNLEKPSIFINNQYFSNTTFHEEILQEEKDYQIIGQQRMKTRSQSKLLNQKNSSLIKNIIDQRKLKHQKNKIDKYDFTKHIDFLENNCLILQNNKVNEKGKLIINNFPINKYNILTVYISSQSTNIIRHFIIPSFKKNQETPIRILKLQKTLDLENGYEQIRQIQVLQKNQQIDYFKGSEKLIINSLKQLYNIQMEKQKNQDHGIFKEWSFVKIWYSLNHEQKLQILNQYSSHELHLFIYFKDRQFFDKIVKPFLNNKLIKSFIDYFLLNDENNMLSYYEIQNLSELNYMELCLFILFLVNKNELEKAQIIQNQIQVQELILDTQYQQNQFDDILNLQVNEQEQFDKQNKQKKIIQQKEQNFAVEDFNQQSFGYPHLQSFTFNQQQNNTQSYLYYPIQAHYQEQSHRSKRNPNLKGIQSLCDSKQFIERNYLLQNQKNDKIKLNYFWKELAYHILQNKTVEGFISINFNYNIQSFSESILVLTFMDLIQENNVKNKISEKIINQQTIQIKNQNEKGILLLQKNIVKLQHQNLIAEIIVKQKLFDPFNQKETTKEGLVIEKNIEECVINKVYGIRTIITNCSIGEHYINILMQIPEGAVPVNGEDFIYIENITLQEHQYIKYEYYFYFPNPGLFNSYPAAVSKQHVLVSRANKINSIKVNLDRNNVEIISIDEMIRLGDKQSILKTIQQPNILISFEKYYNFIQNDAAFYFEFIQILQNRNLFDFKTWSFSFIHNQYLKVVEQLLNTKQFQFKYLNNINLYYFKSENININTITFYEFNPLLKQRTHNFNSQQLQNKILNDHFNSVYKQFLIYYIQKGQNVNSEDYLVFCYYLLLQDRYQECIEIFKKINYLEISFEIQYDYIDSYLNMFVGTQENYSKARQIVEKYNNYPIIQWRELFLDIQCTLEEVDGNFTYEKELDTKINMYKEKPSQFKVEFFNKEDQKQLKFELQNINYLTIDYYVLDIETIFSRNPFFLSDSKFNYVKSNQQENVKIDSQQTIYMHQIPKQFTNQNLYITIQSKKLQQNINIFINELDIDILNDFGIIILKNKKTQEPIFKGYIKVFAKHTNGIISFYRDGYTDFAGRFDYSIKSTLKIKQIEKFVLLISTDSNGLQIQEIDVPLLDEQDQFLEIHKNNRKHFQKQNIHNFEQLYIKDNQQVQKKAKI